MTDVFVQISDHTPSSVSFAICKMLRMRVYGPVFWRVSHGLSIRSVSYHETWIQHLSWKADNPIISQLQNDSIFLRKLRVSTLKLSENFCLIYSKALWKEDIIVNHKNNLGLIFFKANLLEAPWQKRGCGTSTTGDYTKDYKWLSVS